MADQLGAKAPARDEADSAAESDDAPDIDASDLDADPSVDGRDEPDTGEETDQDSDDDGGEFPAVDLFTPADGDPPDGEVAHDDGEVAHDDGRVTDSAETVDEPAEEAAVEPAHSPVLVRSAPDTDDGPSGVSNMLQRLGIRTRGQLRARKVQRIVRRVDPWSVLKLSLIFYFCVWLMVIVAGVLLWGAAVGSGTISSLESFIAEFLAFEEFRFNGDQLFQIFALGGLIGVFVATAATAVLAVLFNLIADLTGGIRFTVIEEESARRIINPR